MSGFGSLNIAITGMAAAQKAMDVTGQNMVNANTPGYSRQRVQLSSVALPSHDVMGNKRAGVQVDDTVRVRDAFLEATRNAAGAKMESLSAQASALSGAEQLLNEPGENGVQQVMDDFYAAWHDLAANPADRAAGSVVLNRGAQVASALATVVTGLSDRWTTIRHDLDNTVGQANAAASDLAVLNGRIQQTSIAGAPVNELIDQRDQLVRKLGELVGGVAAQSEDGMVNVTVAGISVVSGNRSETLKVSGTYDMNAAADEPPQVTWGSVKVPLESGKAAGLLSSVRTDLPQMSKAVDAVAVAMRDSVNALHTQGFTLGGAAGTNFFTGTSAADLAVAIEDPGSLAVTASPGTIDGSTALRIGDLSIDSKAAALLGGPGASVRWRDLAANIGTKVDSVRRATTVQEAVQATADAAVESDAGVNLDEEMSNMLLWQRAYQASARVISTADAMLDTLINRMAV